MAQTGWRGRIGDPDPVIVVNASGVAVDPSLPGSNLSPLGDQQLTSLASSTALTVPAGATFATVSVTGQTVRWRTSGVPTASLGNTLAVGQSVEISGAASLAAIRFIEEAASAVLDVSYYG